MPAADVFGIALMATGVCPKPEPDGQSLEQTVDVTAQMAGQVGCTAA